METMLNREKLNSVILELPESERVLINTYVQEAYFYYELLREDLTKLAKNSKVIEIGSGIGLLSLFIAELGHRVTAFEPESNGFSHMLAIRKIILSCWEGKIPEVESINDYFGQNYIQDDGPIDYMLAINVLEHMVSMSQIDIFLREIKPLIGLKSIFRVICPNYLMPYEPHFDIPTIINKRATYLLFKKKILEKGFSDGLEMWNELSWPTQRKLQKSIRKANLSSEFSRNASANYLKRAFFDDSLQERKGKVTFFLIKAASALLTPIISVLPKKLLPVLDCSIKLNRS